MSQQTYARLRLRPRPGAPAQGWLAAGPLTIRVALGRTGIRANKREGDGGTPRGTFRPVRLWWRADRHPRPRTLLPVHRIGPEVAWCEDPADRRYTRPFRRDAAGRVSALSVSQDRVWDMRFARREPSPATAH